MDHKMRLKKVRSVDLSTSATLDKMQFVHLLCRDSSSQSLKVSKKEVISTEACRLKLHSDNTADRRPDFVLWT